MAIDRTFSGLEEYTIYAMANQHAKIWRFSAKGSVPDPFFLHHKKTKKAVGHPRLVNTLVSRSQTHFLRLTIPLILYKSNIQLYPSCSLLSETQNADFPLKTA